MKTQEQTKSHQRDFKSRMFAMIFSDKKELLKLYNAVANRNYEDPELLEINTLENAFYMSMKNDLSFIIDSRLSLYEHQSTYNPNMPLRFLLYLSELYSGMVAGKNIYGRTRIPLPPPRFIVFYNGTEERPDREVMHLSDSYTIQGEEVWLELRADVLNVNLGHNKELLNACQTLHDYAEYVHRMRKYAKTMTIGDAVDRAIEECIQDGILKEFLEQNRAEAKAMSIFEYNQEEHIRMEREEAKKEATEAERTNTERERQRADAAEKLAKEAESRAEKATVWAKDANARADQAEAQMAEARKAIAELNAEIARLKAITKTNEN